MVNQSLSHGIKKMEERKREQEILGNYRTSANSRSFTDFKLQEPLPTIIDVNITIVNKINNQIRKYYVTITLLNEEALDNFRTPSKTVFVL